MYTDRHAPHLRTETRLLVILPFCCCEQHGPYLPIDTDLRIAELLAEKLVRSFSETVALLLPAILFRCSWEHKGLRTLAAMIHDVAHSLKGWNMPVFLLLINWHGGNDVLTSLATEITGSEGIPTAVIPAIS